MDATIFIPTKNAGEPFREVLEAIFHQETDFEYEVVCVDSGSSDNTLSIIAEYPQIRLHQIPASEFGHGKTRSLAISLGTGEFIVFITQDAMPASPTWLDMMLKAIKKDENCAVCFGIHYPYPECNILDERDIIGHFQGFGTETTYYRLDDPERYEKEEGYRHLLAFSSDNNACVRRSIFEQYPYPDVEFAEDQIWTREMIEKGYSKVYCPSAPVFHSHNYPLKEYYRRYYDEYKGLREIHDYQIAEKKSQILPGIRRTVKNDVAYIRKLPMTYSEKFHWCWYSLRRNKYRHVAGYYGGIYQDCPEGKQERMDRRWSQQYEQRNRKKAVRQKKAYCNREGLSVGRDYQSLWKYARERYLNGRIIGNGQNTGPQLIHVEDVYDFVLKTRTFPINEKEKAEAENGPITLHWVIPEPGVGSGGHLNIFRFVAALENRGLKNRIYLFDAKNYSSNQEIRDFIHKYYPILPQEIEIYHSCENMPFCHAIIATGWTTAYFVRRFQNTISHFYFVQDFEPLFYPMGSEYKLAENTYRFGFRGLTAGDWLKNKLEKEFDMPCSSFHFSYDKDMYHPIEKRDKVKRVFFYARPVTPRRAWELGLLSLIRLHELVPDLEVVFAGWDISGYYIPFIHLNAGSVSLDKLADLYAQCDICLVMSLTNLSLLPLEVMASNSVIATQPDENNAWMVNETNAIMINTDPIHIAETLADYLHHPEKLAAIRERALTYAQATDWNKETEKVYQSILEGIQEDGQK